MAFAHCVLLGLSVPRLRPSLFLAAHFLPSSVNFQPEASQVLSVVLSSWVLPLHFLVDVLVAAFHKAIRTLLTVLVSPMIQMRSCLRCTGCRFDAKLNHFLQISVLTVPYFRDLWRYMISAEVLPLPITYIDRLSAQGNAAPIYISYIFDFEVRL